MKQIRQLCKSLILNLVHKIVQNFSIWCAFTCLIRQKSFFDSIQKLHFRKVPKMRLKFFSTVRWHTKGENIKILPLISKYQTSLFKSYQQKKVPFIADFPIDSKHQSEKLKQKIHPNLLYLIIHHHA